MSAIGNISAVCQQPVQIQEKSVFLTDAKVKQIALTALSGVALAGAIQTTALACTASPWLAAAAIPLYLAAGVFAWKAFHIIDYDNPQKLAAIRDQAAQLPLSQVVKQHGWNRIFRYAILSPLQFEGAYRFHMEGLSLNDVISTYRMVSDEIRKAGAQDRYLPLPPIVWANKLAAETNGYNFNLLIRGYSLKELIAYNLISPIAFNQSFQSFMESSSFVDLIHCQNIGKRQISEASTACNSTIVKEFKVDVPYQLWTKKFDSEFRHKNASEIVLKMGRDLPFLNEENIISPGKYAILEKAQTRIEHARERVMRVHRDMTERLTAYKTIQEQSNAWADKTYQAHAAHALIRNLHTCEREERMALQNRFDANARLHPEDAASILSAKKDALRLLEAGYREKRAPYENLLGQAYQLRNLAYDLAEKEFCAAKISLQKEAEWEIAKIEEMRDLFLKDIDREYARY